MSELKIHRRGLLLAALASASALPLATHAAPRSAAEVLAAADAVRNPPGAFSLKTRLIEYRQGKQAADSTLLVYAKPAVDGGQYRNLLRFASPARDANKLMLRNGMDLWFYDPASRASVRVSPQQRLLGQASNGDVMTSQLSRDYRAEITGQEAVKDGEGKLRESTRLHLVATRPDVPYAAVDYWVEDGSDRPVMARYFTVEGRLLKTAYFRRFQMALGQERPTETVIVDGLDPSWVTLMQVSEFTPREVPDEWLQRDFLPHFNAQ